MAAFSAADFDCESETYEKIRINEIKRNTEENNFKAKRVGIRPFFFLRENKVNLLNKFLWKSVGGSVLAKD